MEIQNYPKSSCMLSECKREYVIPTGIKSNISVSGCNISPYFDCYGRVLLNTQKAPVDNNNIVEINREVYTDKLAKGFKAVECEKGKVASSCPKVTFISNDPRQFDSLRAQILPLDGIPIDGDVRLKNIYNNKYDRYGLGFTSYDNIRDGQILYYIDKSIQAPFYKPVYSETIEQQSVLFKDPMGAMKPEYNRLPLRNTENPTVKDRKNYPYRLSFLQDTSSFREDIISLQQRKNNQQKWSARWGNNE